MNILSIDAKKLRRFCKRIEQLKSYQGTPDALPGDDVRLADARRKADAFILRVIFDR